MSSSPCSASFQEGEGGGRPGVWGKIRGNTEVWLRNKDTVLHFSSRPQRSFSSKSFRESLAALLRRERGEGENNPTPKSCPYWSRLAGRGTGRNAGVVLGGPRFKASKPMSKSSVPRSAGQKDSEDVGGELWTIR